MEVSTGEDRSSVDRRREERMNRGKMNRHTLLREGEHLGVYISASQDIKDKITFTNTKGNQESFSVLQYRHSIIF